MPENLDKIKSVFKNTVIPFIIKAAKAVWLYIKDAKIELSILAGALFLDLLTKFIIDKTMTVGTVNEIIPSFLNFRYVLNDKAAFSSAFGLEKIIPQGAIRVIFLIMTTIAISAFFYVLYRFRNKALMPRIAFAFIISGALGNYYDRMFNGGNVRDFIEIVFFGLDLPLLGDTFAIFNIADAALTVGVILFAVYFIILYKPPKYELVGPVWIDTSNEVVEIEQTVEQEEKLEVLQEALNESGENNAEKGEQEEDLSEQGTKNING